ncbi:MAG: PQQ-binding-like beta-propeller repeat protein [Sphingomicrobium sp.]
MAIGLTIGLGACQGGHEDSNQAGELVQSTDEFQSRAGKPIDVEHHPGKDLFETNCAGCHNGAVPKAPQQVWLEMMSPDAVLAALNGGVMARQAAALSPQQRVQIAEYLSRISLADYKAPAPSARCPSAQLAGNQPPALVGWGHDNRRFVPASVAGLAKADVPRLKLKWAFAYPGAIRARSQPAIGWGTLFVGGHDGTLYAFDLATGCLRWSSRVSAEVRTAIVADPASKRLYFGDILGRAYALDAMTGRLLWKRKVDDHPNATITGTPTLAAGMLFVPVSSLEVTSAADPKYACCTFRGKVIALNLADGSEKWRAFTVTEPPRSQGKTSTGTSILGPSGAPVWNAPTYDAKRGLLYFGSGENYSSPADANSDAVIAVHAATGKRKWTAQLTRGDAWNVGCMMANENCPKEKGPDLDVAASPLLIPIGGGRDIIVAGQKSGVVFGIDPDSGKLLWQRRLGHGGTQGGVHFGMAAEGLRVFVPINDMADTKDGRKYDARISGAGLHALDARSGRVLWSNKAPDNCAGKPFCDPGISSAVTAIPGVVFAGHLDGQFRAYDSVTGKVLWAVDTTRPVKTITGAEGHGGGMSGPGAAIGDGYVAVNSGYGLYYHMPGNVLLVFAAR